MNDFERRKLEDLRKKTDTVDGSPLAGFILNEVPKMSDDEKERMINIIRKSAYDAGNMVIERALMEGVFTDKEWLYMKNQLKITVEDLGSVLTAYFHKVKAKEEVVVVTSPDSTTMNNKKYIKKRFNIRMVSIQQAIKMMEKEKKEK